MSWMDKHLVPGWRDSWRWFSVQALTIGTVLVGLIAGHPDLLLLLISMLGGSSKLQLLVVAGALAILALRLWNQEAGDDANE